MTTGDSAAPRLRIAAEIARHGCWPRVWAARGLLHAWDPAAARAITGATRDEAWRVRKMAARVIARHRVGDGARAVTLLTAAGA